MTAQVGLLNKEAIALASDSAVTYSQQAGQKIYSSANKIFSLSKYYPVAIMVSGNANFMDIPWDTVIKLYRKNLNKTKLDKVADYLNNFIEFLKNDKNLVTEDLQKKHFFDVITPYCYQIINQVVTNVNNERKQNKRISKRTEKSIIAKVINDENVAFSQVKDLAYIPKDYIKTVKAKYFVEIGKTIQQIFDIYKIRLNKKQHKIIMDLCLGLFSKDSFGLVGNSEIVIAGFGEKEVFPSLISALVEGLFEGVLKWKENRRADISHTCNAAIRPFAQTDVVFSFMEGVLPDYEKEVEKCLSEIIHHLPPTIIDSIQKLTLAEKDALKGQFKQNSAGLLKNFQDRLVKFRKGRYVSPVLDIVGMLPKDELAAMAESLVNLTSFKKKMSLQAETVGGPVDVLVISKGDGLVWIKRKHYFKQELNPHFIKNYWEDEE
jgi:hypothetical protein